MLFTTLWKWLFAGEIATQMNSDDPVSANQDEQTFIDWAAIQREYASFGLPHFWG